MKSIPIGQLSAAFIHFFLLFRIFTPLYKLCWQAYEQHRKKEEKADMNVRKARSDRMAQFRQGFIACVPTLLGYWAVGFACGAIGKVSGFNVIEIALLSIFLYAGSAHFLFYSLAATGAGIAEIAFAIAFINMRYLLINTYMAQFFKRSSLKEKLIGGLLITDETFGVAARYANHQGGELPFYWLLGLNLTAWVNWIL